MQDRGRKLPVSSLAFNTRCRDDNRNWWSKLPLFFPGSIYQPQVSCRVSQVYWISLELKHLFQFLQIGVVNCCPHTQRELEILQRRFLWAEEYLLLTCSAASSSLGVSVPCTPEGSTQLARGNASSPAVPADFQTSSCFLSAYWCNWWWAPDFAVCWEWKLEEKKKNRAGIMHPTQMVTSVWGMKMHPLACSSRGFSRIFCCRAP